MKVTMMAIVVGSFGSIPKGLANRQENFEIQEQVDTLQTAALLRSVRILRRVLEA